jgi:hypothetical protein
MATALVLAVATQCCLPAANAASIIFDDFNVDEGHFNLAPAFSGSTSNIVNATSTADRITTDAAEGDGSQQLVLNMTSEAAATRVRFLSGGGTAANNTAFTTSAAEDGWIGMYLKTDSPDWTAQIWLEGASNNGSVPKTIIADGQWHLYEWNIDDISGGADGWGSIAGIIAGVATVADGSHTIDSVLFRHTAPSPATATIFMDFVAKSESGSVANLLPIPEPTSLALVGLIGVVAAGMRTRR